MMARLAAALMAVFFALPALAADGDGIRQVSRGDYQVFEILLCDSKASGASECGPVDVSGRGMPTFVSAAIEGDAGCTAGPTVEVSVQRDDGDEHIIDTLSVAGTSMKVSWPPPGFVYTADLANMANCTDLDVVLSLYYWRK